MIEPNETDFYADAVENLVSLIYNGNGTRADASYSDWVDTKSNDLLIHYEPPKGKDTTLGTSV